MSVVRISQRVIESGLTIGSIVDDNISSALIRIAVNP